MLCLTGCATTKKITEVEYVVPGIIFPEFPELVTEYEDSTDRVYMSLDEFERLYRFKLRYDGIQEYYKRTKELYEGLSNED